MRRRSTNDMTHLHPDRAAQDAQPPARPSAPEHAVRLDKLLTAACADSSVSDLHIEEGQPIWARRKGKMQAVPGTVVPRAAILDFLSHKQHETGLAVDTLTKTLAARGDEDAAVSVGDVRFRLNVYLTNDRKLALAVRRISSQIPAIETLALPGAYLGLVAQSKGLLLVTGATGSGKSTTLAATLEHINCTRAGHIITLEDPVEFQLSSKKSLVHQRQVRRDTKDFATSLRAALRQDPDVILVGELRDADTVKTALDAANTGHLVLGTLHTSGAQQSIERLTSFFPPDGRGHVASVLSQVLLGVLSQTLVMRRDGAGRALACELLINTPSVRSAIRDLKASAIFGAMDTGRREGQKLMHHSLLELVRSNVITSEEALFYATDPVAMARELGASRG